MCKLISSSAIKEIIRCDEPWFSLLARGIKPVEGRKGHAKYKNLKPSDCIRFECGEKAFLANVERVESFQSIAEYLEKVSLDKALPGITDFNEGLRIYAQWNRDEEVEKHGFVAIWIRII
jgi:ASC-1-like (ASCH) protein